MQLQVPADLLQISFISTNTNTSTDTNTKVKLNVGGMNNEGYMQLQVPADLLPDAQGRTLHCFSNIRQIQTQTQM